ncbi:hypothetical protein Bcep1808_3577 [Burkholderia vietnamiensis G4]|uniref:Uncharacterized protein n=1 Tax=Burkholderia vietnamiensis (strain G4 / LMG 22486) TaxID=269482 RepID=A4JJW1_BURVG|nr:hypothetical protein Bcep1808_3577 [Burkholderia vietnamiensis G4]
MRRGMKAMRENVSSKVVVMAPAVGGIAEPHDSTASLPPARRRSNFPVAFPRTRVSNERWLTRSRCEAAAVRMTAPGIRRAAGTDRSPRARDPAKPSIRPSSTRAPSRRARAPHTASALLDVEVDGCVIPGATVITNLITRGTNGDRVSVISDIGVVPVKPDVLDTAAVCKLILKLTFRSRHKTVRIAFPLASLAIRDFLRRICHPFPVQQVDRRGIQE